MSTNVLVNFSAQQSQPSDDQLLSEARSGNGRAFSELCQRYSGLLKKRIFRIVRHREDTEDALQETFLNAYRHLDGFQNRCSFSTWLTKIGVNTSLMLLRKRQTVLKHTSDLVTDDGRQFETPEFRDPAPDPEQHFMMDQAHQRIERAVRKLPPRFANIVNLYYGQECRLKEAAKVLGVSEPAAKSMVLRARNFLRRSFNRRLSGGPTRPSRP